MTAQVAIISTEGLDLTKALFINLINKPQSILENIISGILIPLTEYISVHQKGLLIWHL